MDSISGNLGYFTEKGPGFSEGKIALTNRVMISFTYMRSEADCILRTSPLGLSFSRGATRYAMCDITLLPDTREKGLL